MNTTREVLASLCVFCGLLTGCYSSTLIDPRADREEIESHDIAVAVMNNNTKYIFDKPPAIVRDSIVGPVKKVIGKIEVTIPTIDVAQATESQAGKIGRLTTKSGTSYLFDTPPAFVEKTIVGIAAEKDTQPMKVTLALADVVAVGVKKCNGWATAALVFGTATAVTLVVISNRDREPGTPFVAPRLWEFPTPQF